MVGVCWAVCMVDAKHARGQAAESGVQVGVAFDAVGVAGRVRPGDWTPIRLTLTNAAPSEREVVCRWVLEDSDGDTVQAERRVTLAGSASGGVTGGQYVWLYGVPPLGRSLEEPWRVQVVDGGTGEELATVRVAPLEWVRPEESVVGVLSAAPVGLTPYASRATSHEARRMLEGLTLAELPDRWMGLDTLGVLVWASDGGDPGGVSVPPAVLGAVREWVRRGGHLVLLMPAAGEPWTGSPLGDMLPVARGSVRPVQGEPPAYLGAPGRRETIDMVTFAPRPTPPRGQAVAVVARDREDRPSVVAGRYGFGRVTVVGVDLTSPQVRGLRLTPPRQGLWNLVLGLTSPIYSQAYIDQARGTGDMDRPEGRRDIPLGDSLLTGADRQDTAAPAVMTAVLVLLVYWLVAGPGLFLVLKARGRAEHAWVAFVGVVVVFAAVSWGGAWLMRPSGAYFAHVTVLDLDGNTGEARADAWVSGFLPRFGRATYALGAVPEEETSPAAAVDHDRRDTLWAPGLPTDAVDAGGFLDPQTYQWHVAEPGELNVPIRATTKRLHARFRGPSSELRGVEGGDFGTIAGGLQVESSGFPRGTMRHSLPGPLENVLVVYAAGDGTVWVQPPGLNGDLTRWEPGEDLSLGSRFVELVRPPGPPPRGELPYSERKLNDEGFLGQLMAQGAGGAGVTGVGSTADVAKVVTLLSFYNLLPPPDFRQMTLMPTNKSINYIRGVGRAWDLSHLTDARRILIIAQLRDSPLPIPLTADGERLPSEGLTIVRWVLDL